MKIKFVEPSMLHPDSNVSIFEVARILEREYRLCERFINNNTIIIVEKTLEFAMRGYSKERLIFMLENTIMNMWQEYIRNELHNIKTKASIKENRKSFIRSGLYYKSMRIVVEL